MGLPPKDSLVSLETTNFPAGNPSQSLEHTPDFGQAQVSVHIPNKFVKYSYTPPPLDAMAKFREEIRTLNRVRDLLCFSV